MAFLFDSNDTDENISQNPQSVSSPVESSRKDYVEFKNRLHHEILRSQRRDHSFTLMRLAMDIRPEITPQIHQLLKTCIREYDLCCAVQPAQYAVFFPETNEEIAEIIAGRIRARFKENSGWIETMPLVDPAIGIACFPQDGTNAEDLLDSAEKELRIERKKQEN